MGPECPRAGGVSIVYGKVSIRLDSALLYVVHGGVKGDPVRKGGLPLPGARTFLSAAT